MKSLILDTLINIPILNLWLFFIYFFLKSNFWKKLFLYSNFCLLLVSSLPITSTLLKEPLYYDSQKVSSIKKNPEYVLVLTAGIFKDNYGNWYPSSESIRRVQFGKFLSDKYLIPIIISGGGVNKIKEAEVLAKYFKYDFYLIEIESSNTFEVGINLKNRMDLTDKPLLLATNPNHHLRSVLVLKKHNIETLIPDEYVTNRRVSYSVLPNIRGLSAFNNAIYEYLGLVWYYFNGKI